MFGPIETAIIQRKCAACAAADKGGSSAIATKNPVRRRADAAHAGHDGSQPVGTAAASRIRGLQSSGAPLPQAARDQFEPRFGHDFSSVRVHTGGAAAESARELGAQAYTLGQDIVFAAGRYAPETPAGRQLLAHELTHTIQQTGGAPLAPATASAAENASETVSRTREGHEPRGGAAMRSRPLRGRRAAGGAAAVGPYGAARAYGFCRQPPSHDGFDLRAPPYQRTPRRDFTTLTATPLPPPHPRLPWTAEAEAIAAIIEELGSYVRADPGYGATRLYEMSYPADLWGVIDEMRGAGPIPKIPMSAIDVFHYPSARARGSRRSASPSPQRSTTPSWDRSAGWACACASSSITRFASNTPISTAHPSMRPPRLLQHARPCGEFTHRPGDGERARAPRDHPTQAEREGHAR